MNSKRQEKSSISEKYSPKRLLNEQMAKFIQKHLSANAFEYFHECGTFLEFASDKSFEKKKLTGANFCKNRFCPMCSWRKSCKDALLLQTMMTAINVEKEYRFIFVTLTMPNVPSEELKTTIDLYNQAFKRMVQRKKIKQMNHGYMRKLEMTYNEDRDDYHPHFHCLFAVDKAYFTNPKKYLSHENWLEYWRHATRNDSITQVNVQAVKQNTRNSNESQTINEMSKYVVKHTNIIQNQEVFDDFYFALKGRQLITYNGIFREYKKKYENGELDKYMAIDETEYIYLLQYFWNKSIKEYDEDQTTYRLMTDTEYEKINGRPKDLDDFID